MLSDKEVEIIADVITEAGVTFKSLQDDLIDHIACIIEDEMEKGKSFQDALNNARTIFTNEELENTQESTLYLLTLKSKKMKKTAGLTGIVASISVLIGVFFKLMHWPGASILLLIGLVLAALIVLPLMAFVSLHKNDSMLNYVGILSAYLGGIILTLSALFKMFHWPYANMLSSIGFTLICLVAIPLFLIKSYKLVENRVYAISKALLILAGVILLWALTPISKTVKVKYTEEVETRKD
jgi:hypothetical protein